MGLRLLLSSMWLPSGLLENELNRVASQTTEALLILLGEIAPLKLADASLKIKALTGSVGERRAIMAHNHFVLVEVLSTGIGQDEAVKVGREALFKVGVRLGEESRTRLGVGDNVGDLVLAARVLYRVLGISFTVHREGEALELIIHRCALSPHYSELSCRVLSAVDEGVVRGLNDRVSMRFERRMTAGFPTCSAHIVIKSGEEPS